MQERRPIKRNNYWIGLILVLFALADVAGRWLFFLLPLVLLGVVGWRMGKVISRREQDGSADAGPVPARPAPMRRVSKGATTASWEDERRSLERGFDEQRIRQSGGSLTAEQLQDEYRQRVEELGDLLSAGIIERSEYADRMAELNGTLYR